uniref:Neurotransmitter-gated ion-channel ligand-binding domain-containing protein n=1 Tax=Pelagomonas calceolata TaxID=35677 RepID=A0A7S3ZTL6_9STRA|mmetsp:Transcript_10331/g.27354  ORF Transcript_10331/g.27354 Transcript_10331/m.27354 type:complete len:352 (+) Transcript_10331:236-1291(+)
MTKVVPSANDGAEQAVPKTLDPATVNWSDRPVPADGGVTRVSVELNVQEFKVDTHNGEFLQATFWVVLEWEDPRLLAAGIDTSDPSAMPKDIWRPAACFPTNFAWADDEPPVTFLSLAPGRLMWWRQTKPTHVDISSAGGGEERFRSFPFDSARIDWLFCMSDEVKLETDVDIELDFDRRNVKSQGGELRQMEWVGQRRQGEFVCTAVTFGVFKHSSPNTGLVYRDCIWSLHVQRDPTYYIFKGAVPIYVIVAFAFFQFAMDVDAQLTERLNFLVALMLSSFAIQWTVTDRLPRVPFVTALDRLIFASLLALFMMALGSVVESCVESTSELGYSSGHGDDVASMAWKLHAI